MRDDYAIFISRRIMRFKLRGPEAFVGRLAVHFTRGAFRTREGGGAGFLRFAALWFTLAVHVETRNSQQLRVRRRASLADIHAGMGRGHHLRNLTRCLRQVIWLIHHGHAIDISFCCRVGLLCLWRLRLCDLCRLLTREASTFFMTVLLAGRIYNKQTFATHFSLSCTRVFSNTSNGKKNFDRHTSAHCQCTYMFSNACFCQISSIDK